MESPTAIVILYRKMGISNQQIESFVNFAANSHMDSKNPRGYSPIMIPGPQTIGYFFTVPYSSCSHFLIQSAKLTMIKILEEVTLDFKFVITTKYFIKGVHV
jgi:hypothetical protein